MVRERGKYNKKWHARRKTQDKKKQDCQWTLGSSRSINQSDVRSVCLVVVFLGRVSVGASAFVAHFLSCLGLLFRFVVLVLVPVPGMLWHGGVLLVFVFYLVILVHSCSSFILIPFFIVLMFFACCVYMIRAFY
jgi:hypothetical protein